MNTQLNTTEILQLIKLVSENAEYLSRVPSRNMDQYYALLDKLSKMLLEAAMPNVMPK